MKKKLFLSAIAAAVLSSGMTVCAAPQYMADGEIFDPEWYLEQNPDVAAWPLGTSAEALYNHYTLHGKYEWDSSMPDHRTPYNKATLDRANILPYQGADSAAAAQSAEAEQPSQEEPTDSNRIMAVEGETYRFPNIHTERYDYADCMVNISFYKVENPEDPEGNAYFTDYLEPYSLPGYEWKAFDVSATTDAAVVWSTNIGAIDSSKADFLRGRTIDWDDNTISDFETVWQHIDENGWVTHVGTFTVNQNGVQYPDCQIFETWNMGINDMGYYSWYALVPKNFNGEQLSAGYCAIKLENGEPVENEAVPRIYFNF